MFIALFDALVHTYEGQRAEPSARLFVRLQPDVQSFTVKEIIHTWSSTDRELCRTQASGRWPVAGCGNMGVDIGSHKRAYLRKMQKSLSHYACAAKSFAGHVVGGNQVIEDSKKH